MLQIINISTEPQCAECETVKMPIVFKNMDHVETYRSILKDRYKLREVFFTIKQLINENSPADIR